MSKLLKKAKSSKLTSQPISKHTGQSSIVTKIENKEYPRSYRMDTEAINMIKDTLDRINASSPKKVSESKLIKALIHLSKDIETEALLKAAKEIW